MLSTLTGRLHHLRELANLSARELDRLSRLRQGHTALIEKRASDNLETSTAQALAGVLGVSLDWLIAGDGKMPSARIVRAAVEAARAEHAKREAAKALAASQNDAAKAAG